MSEIKNITTDVPIAETIDGSTDPTIYIEYNGKFCRTKGKQMRKIIELDGLVCVDGMLCVDIEEEEDN